MPAMPGYKPTKTDVCTILAANVPKLNFFFISDDGSHKCVLWNAFASRGLGQGAKNYKDSTDVPSDCK